MSIHKTKTNLDNNKAETVENTILLLMNSYNFNQYNENAKIYNLLEEMSTEDCKKIYQNIGKNVYQLITEAHLSSRFSPYVKLTTKSLDSHVKPLKKNFSVFKFTLFDNPIIKEEHQDFINNLSLARRAKDIEQCNTQNIEQHHIQTIVQNLKDNYNFTSNQEDYKIHTLLERTFKKACSEILSQGSKTNIYTLITHACLLGRINPYLEVPNRQFLGRNFSLFDNPIIKIEHKMFLERLLVKEASKACNFKVLQQEKLVLDMLKNTALLK